MLKVAETIDHITAWLEAYCQTAGSQGYVVGISGGVDSAVVSALCGRTGLPVLGVTLPIHQVEAHDTRARQHLAWLAARFPNVSAIRVELTATFDVLTRALPTADDTSRAALAGANSRARLRMTTLYHLATTHRMLVAGTGNKIEDFGVGFFTKYGDGGVDLSPIGDLTKSEVYALAEHLGIVASIRQAKPSDGLFADDRSDEDQLGATYPELEWAMAFRESGAEADETALTSRQRDVLETYDRLHTANAHKWKPIPVCVIPKGLRG